MKYLLVPIFMLAAATMRGQDAVPDQFINDSLEIVKVKLVRPQFRFDNRQTFVGKQAFSITGFDVGVLLSEKLRFTLGYYSMSDRIKEFDEVIEGIEYGRLVDLRYGAINTELIYRDTRFLSFGMPLEIGVGMNKFQRVNIASGEVLQTQQGAIAFVNFGMSATFKPMRFLGLKGMVGYRKVAFNQVKDYNFDGFFTGIGLNIDIHAIVTDFRMYRLMKRYHRGNNIANAVQILTD